MARSGWASLWGATALLIAVTVQAHADDQTAAAKHRLRYQFAPGESVYFTVANTTQRGIQYSDRRVNTNEGADSLKHYRVLSIQPDGNAVLELTIDRVRMFVEQDDVRFAYDSLRDAKAPEGFESVSLSVARPWLHVTVSPRGETVDSREPSQAEAATSPANRDSRTKQLNASDFLTRVLPLLPEDEVSVGAVWKEPFTIDVPESEKLMRPIRLQRVYKLQEVEGDVATISFKTQVLTADKTEKQEGVLAQILYFGTFRIDLTKGQLLSRHLRLDQMALNFDGPASAMSLKLDQRDELAPAGAATPESPERTAAAATASAGR